MEKAWTVNAKYSSIQLKKTHWNTEKLRDYFYSNTHNHIKQPKQFYQTQFFSVTKGNCEFIRIG